MAENDNPCFDCNACCRHFRVSFYQGELDGQSGGHVPADMTVQISPFRACMKGTESGNGRCIALQDDGRCGIYAQRPSVCREFPVYMEDGSMNPECLRLRALLGIGTSAPDRDIGDNPASQNAAPSDVRQRRNNEYGN